jgi:hypothetical protein
VLVKGRKYNLLPSRAPRGLHRRSVHIGELAQSRSIEPHGKDLVFAVIIGGGENEHAGQGILAGIASQQPAGGKPGTNQYDREPHHHRIEILPIHDFSGL